MMELFQGLIVSAILLGCMYTLVAMGFSLFFGVMDVVVFCCGDIAILGSFTVMGAWVVLRSAGLFETLPFAACVALLVLAGALICAFMGLITYRASIAPFRESSGLMPLLSTIAMGTVIKEVLGLLFKPVVNALSAAAGSASALSVTSGRNPQGFPKLLEPLTPSWWAGNAPLDFTKAAIIVVTVVILTLLFLFLNKTKMGLSMQAVAQNKELSLMIGINVSRVIVVTFLTGGVLLAIGGFLMGNYQGIMSFDNGAVYGAKGFSAAVVGGLRNTWGAVAGGMLLAFVEVFVAGYAPGGMAYANIVAFVVVVVFIVFKPEGIIGEKSVEKV